MSIVSGPIAAESSRKSASRAASTELEIATAAREQQERLLKPFWEAGVEAIPDIKEGARTGLPSYEEEVFKPMEDWNFEATPTYKAKYSLAMEELNKQLQARGLAPSGVGASRAADVARRLTAEDYETERSYRQAQLSDKYRNSLSENTTRYNRLLDLVKGGQGAAGSMGQAENAFAQNAIESTRERGRANANFFAGLGGAPGSTAGSGLRLYDYGKNQGWWGGGSAGTNAGTNYAAAEGISESYSADAMAAEGLYGL